MAIKNTIIIGLGNPILTDDGAGIRAARILKGRLGEEEDVEVIELYAGGLRLMDAMIGRSRAVIIDAMQTGGSPGTVIRTSPAELPLTRNITCSHDIGLGTALELGRTMGQKVPYEVIIYGIEAADVSTFGEALTEAVGRAVEMVSEEIIREL